MEPEQVRQFASKAARCKARAAFELCGVADDASLREPGSEILPNAAEQTGDVDRSECDKERRH